jgi:hypothetical protein
MVLEIVVVDHHDNRFCLWSPLFPQTNKTYKPPKRRAPPKHQRRPLPKDQRRALPKDQRRALPKDQRRDLPKDQRRDLPKDQRWPQQLLLCNKMCQVTHWRRMPVAVKVEATRRLLMPHNSRMYLRRQKPKRRRPMLPPSPRMETRSHRSSGISPPHDSHRSYGKFLSYSEKSSLRTHHR